MLFLLVGVRVRRCASSRIAVVVGGIVGVGVGTRVHYYSHHYYFCH